MWPLLLWLLGGLGSSATATTSSRPSEPSPSSSFSSYLNQRTSFLLHQADLSINSAWTLTPKEQQVNDILLALRDIDLTLDPIPIQFNFVSMKPTIDQSQLLRFLKSFPKGALLHSHDTSSQDMHFYVTSSYLSGCLYSLNEEDYGALSFLPTPGYVPISEIRFTW